MKTQYTFDDVLISPNFSTLDSRKEVDLSLTFGNIDMKLPIFSSNMATITEHEMCKSIRENGGIGVYHRFWPIEDNFEAFSSTNIGYECAVSVGVGEKEIGRARALIAAGARMFFLDVAHGAQLQVVEQYKKLKDIGCDFVVVGNFGNSISLEIFAENLYLKNYTLDGVKIGIGPGSACTTRIKTGIGVPQLSAVQDITKLKHYLQDVNPLMIADGGMRTPGDIAKAIAAGADAVMLGGMLAGTDETPGELIADSIQQARFDDAEGSMTLDNYTKVYKGSACNDSSFCEGDAFVVPYKGPVKQILEDIKGGLQSAFSYVGAKNIKEFQEKAELVLVTGAGHTEGTAHGKK